jgi:hypothetical protein
MVLLRSVAEALVKETAASRAVADLPAKLVSAGFPVETAQALAKVVKDYLASYPKSEDRAFRELTNLGLEKDSANALLQSLDDSMKAS